MIKSHLGDLIDIRFIIILTILIALTVVLTMVFSDKVKEFSKKYQRKFYIYALSLMFLYALVAFLGFNKLFSTLSNEFLFYQIATLFFGIIHAYFYRWYFDSFDQDSLSIEMLFALVMVLYSGFPFIIIYTALSGLEFTLLMCSQFIVFFIPTMVNGIFEYMEKIQSKIYMTWQISKDEVLKVLKSEDMKNIVLITLLIKKKNNSTEYSSFRSKAPQALDFGVLFYRTISDYNARNSDDKIETERNGKADNWVFFLQAKWYQASKYVDPTNNLHMNGIAENSVIICERKSIPIIEKEAENIFDNSKYVQDKNNENKDPETVIEVD